MPHGHLLTLRANTRTTPGACQRQEITKNIHKPLCKRNILVLQCGKWLEMLGMT
jgi:hypothetical protein